MIVGGYPSTKVDRKPRMDSSVCSSVKYPRINDSMDMTCLNSSGNFEVE